MDLCIALLFVSLNIVVMLEVTALAELDCECGVRHVPEFGTRISGGRRAHRHAHPWLAALVGPEGTIHCGAALLTDRHLLTAGHCFKWSDYRDIVAFLGLHDFRRVGGVVQRQVVASRIHESFTSTAIRDDYDIAVLTLDRPVLFDDKVSPVCLPAPGDLSHAYKSSVIAGWGREGWRKSTSKVLLETKVTVLDQSDCFNTSLAEHLTENMMCAFSQGRDGCQGDSGGPLVHRTKINPDKYVIIGIVSWGVGCAHPRYPGVYTNVSQYMDWINESIADGAMCAFK